LGFGKYRGRLLKDVARLDGEYLNWVIYEGDFSDQVKQAVREAVNSWRYSLRPLEKGE